MWLPVLSLEALLGVPLNTNYEHINIDNMFSKILKLWDRWEIGQELAATVREVIVWRWLA